MITRLLLIITLCVLVSGCAVTAEQWKEHNKAGNEVECMRLSGWGAEKAKFTNSGEIEKRETIRVPDISTDVFRR